MTQNFLKLTTMTEARKNSTETTTFSKLSARKRSKVGVSAKANTPKRRFRSQKICDAEIEVSAEAEVPLPPLLRQRRKWKFRFRGNSKICLSVTGVKQLCFGWLEKSRPPEGPRLRWKDRVADDIKRLRIPSDWYALAQDRPAWRAAYSVAWPSPPPRPVVLCSVCDRSFGPSGFKHHKCTDQRELPVHLQRGAKQCLACYRWFRSAGGLSVHKCNVSVVTRPAA